jgi:leucyl-tRNA---protein transferase
MVAQKHILPTELDVYLAKGWFRMTDQLFTTDYIPFNERLHRVHWLRFVIDRLNYSREAKRLFKLAKNFSQEIVPFKIDDETTDLYDHFRSSRKLYLDTPLSENFTGRSGINPLDTRMIKVRDGDTLIACGYFDKGHTSIAGILNVYHPAYEKFSLGKQCMLLKMEYCRNNGIKYYYPGYIISGLARFDYKLFPCRDSAEIYDSGSGDWISFVRKPEEQPIEISEELLEAIRNAGGDISIAES